MGLEDDDGLEACGGGVTDSEAPRAKARSSKHDYQNQTRRPRPSLSPHVRFYRISIMASLSQDDIKALEQTRQRLLRLYTSLTALQQNVFEQQPLPSW